MYRIFPTRAEQAFIASLPRSHPIFTGSCRSLGQLFAHPLPSGPIRPATMLHLPAHQTPTPTSDPNPWPTPCADPRITKLARVITQYSTRIQPGQLVRISGEPGATPLIEALYEQAQGRGTSAGAPAPGKLAGAFLRVRQRRAAQVRQSAALEEIKRIDVSIGIWAEANTRALTRVDPKRQSPPRPPASR